MTGWAVPREVDGDGRFSLPRQGVVPAYLKCHEEGRQVRPSFPIPVLALT